MENSFVLGLFFSVLLFLLCLFTVVGAKIVVNAFKERFIKPAPQPVKQVRKKRKKSQPAKNPALIRSIEINPEEIDRIYVKKSS